MRCLCAGCVERNFGFPSDHQWAIVITRPHHARAANILTGDGVTIPYLRERETVDDKHGTSEYFPRIQLLLTS